MQMDTQAKKNMPTLFVHIRLLWMQRKVPRGRKQKHIMKLWTQLDRVNSFPGMVSHARPFFYLASYVGSK
jgi:hypothetical protein